MRFSVALLSAWLLACTPPPRAHGPLRQQVYVWQQDWTPAVLAAVRERAATFDRTLVLGAEVSWTGATPHVRWLPLGAAVPRDRPLGVVLRVNPLAGGLAQPQVAAQLMAVALELLARVRAAGLPLAELQVDYDAATAQVPAYAGWLQALRPQLHGAPLTITALPTWVDHAGWGPLVATVDGFVLQVHALVAPAGPNQPAHLCDAQAARQAVERAAETGKPFRVALPTYAYAVAFAADGHISGLVAEGAPPSMPPGTRWQDLAAVPQELAALVRAWTADRPRNLEAIVWFRLPVDGDARNWRWPTLQAVRAGRSPQPQLQLTAQQTAQGDVEILAANGGEADAALPRRVLLNWPLPAHALASDALAPYAGAPAGAGLAWLRSPQPVVLPAGATRVLGWVRLDAPVTVEVADEP